MREYDIDEAQKKLPGLIEQVQQGQRITITHRGKPVAHLVPDASTIAQQTQRAIVAIKAMRKGVIDQRQLSEMRLHGRR